ncbi:hypothetical protein K1T71_010027 [Dendrolimus kikuchii]|uniref:Uncharacterized protein n=1 Tax=Dendrolimus kikuchii TaxID=765133 RepID=A0ACC1CQJ5_9NEOP|nr:hypothetical protein K1T71_010027 [Dendrolimus kikuchii]
MQAAPARYVSVSELYSTDEVELLLDEIRELEPTSCRGEDVQALTARGALAAALVACGAGACACAWAAAGLRVALPLAWRLRLLLLGALSSLLLHAALLVAHTTLLTRLLPIDWNKLVCIYAQYRKLKTRN